MADNDLDMSDSDISDQNVPSTGGRKPKRRRLHGACDTCRKKKVKCDSAIMAENICSNCISSKVPCTHNIPRQKKKDTQQEYIRTLEERLRKMEQVLRMSPESRSSKGPSSPADSIRGLTPSSHDAGSSSSTYPELPIPVPRSVPDVTAESPSSIVQDNGGDDSDDLAHVGLSERLKAFSLGPIENRFFGKSSLFAFAEQARLVRKEHVDTPPNFSKVKRPYFWDIRDWEKQLVYETQKPQYVFPEDDLLEHLTKTYFEIVHRIFPAVHRQTFERDLRSRKHLTEPLFGMVVLGVCAVASRHSDDPRVFLNKQDGDGFEGSSAGWKYITQVPVWRNTLFDRTTHYDMQFFALASVYFIGTSMPQVSWNVTGLALRLAEERGIHRRSNIGARPNVVDEAERRAFWCIVAADRVQSSFLGRPCALHDEDIDCDYPIECDDEYWETEDPAAAFQQPEGKPAYTSCFIYNLKLCEIIGFMSRTLYSTKKSKILSGLIGQNWESRIVAELDSSLNKWKDSLPAHLIWDPSNPHTGFYNQSLFLYCTFYYVQIQVHRPFLRRNSPLALSSLAICTNAARTCSHAIDNNLKRGSFCLPNLIMAAFISAMVLTVNFWSSGHKISYDHSKETADIERIRTFLSVAEKRWFVAGRFRDMITEFAIMRGPNLVEASGQPDNRPKKRNRPEDIELPPPNPSLFSNSTLRPSTPPPAMTASSISPAYNQYMPKPDMTKLHMTTPSFSHHPHQHHGIHHSSSSNEHNHRTMHANNEWDLNSLLLAQMGYDQPLGNNFPIPSGNTQPTGPGPTNDSFSTGGAFNGFGSTVPQLALNTVHSGNNAGNVFNNHAQEGSGDNGFDMSMWMSAPKSFSTDEWEAFISVMGPPGGNMPVVL